METRTDSALSKITAAEGQLNSLITEHEGQTFDLTATKGFTQLKEVRAEFRNLRLDIAKTSDKIKDHLNAAKKSLKHETDRVTALVRVPEDHYGKMVADEQERRDTIKREKEEKELKRVTKIQDLIHKISDTSKHAGSFNSVKLSEVIGIMEEYAINDFFQEFKDQAEAARIQVIAELHDFHDLAVKREEEDQARKDEAVRLAKQKEEQDARQAELDAKEVKAMEEEEAAQKANEPPSDEVEYVVDIVDDDTIIRKPEASKLTFPHEIPAEMQETRPIKELADAVVESAVDEAIPKPVGFRPFIYFDKADLAEAILNIATSTSHTIYVASDRIIATCKANMGGGGS